MTNKFSELLAYTEAYTNFPIPAYDVASWLLEHSVLDELAFIQAPEFDPRTIRGMFRRYHRHAAVYGQPINCAQILYAPTMNTCWKRFTWVKEMTHAFDNGIMAAKTMEQVDSLLESLVFPYSAKDAQGPKMPAVTLPFAADQGAEFRAMMVLAPLSIVRQIRPDFLAGRRSAYDVAFYLRIPEAMVPFIMTESYDQIFELFGALDEHLDGRVP